MNQAEKCAALIAEARRTRKWLVSTYQDIWFTPAELEAEQAKGHFVWGACNFKLRDPAERLQSLAADLARAMHNVTSFQKKLEAWQKGD